MVMQTRLRNGAFGLVLLLWFFGSVHAATTFVTVHPSACETNSVIDELGLYRDPLFIFNPVDHAASNLICPVPIEGLVTDRFDNASMMVVKIFGAAESATTEIPQCSFSAVGPGNQSMPPFLIPADPASDQTYTQRLEPGSNPSEPDQMPVSWYNIGIVKIQDISRAFGQAAITSDIVVAISCRLPPGTGISTIYVTTSWTRANPDQTD